LWGLYWPVLCSPSENRRLMTQWSSIAERPSHQDPLKVLFSLQTDARIHPWQFRVRVRCLF
jgi:hypothetical protein